MYNFEVKLKEKKLFRKYRFKKILQKSKKWQVTYIAPLNHLSLLHSCPGEVQQELAV